MKPLIWLGSSRADVRRFPAKARRIAGFQLWRVQLGLSPNDWKPMQALGSSVQEIRIRTGLDHRVLYVAKFAEGVYVLHGFEKRTQKSARRDIEIARKRLSELVVERGGVRRHR